MNTALFTTSTRNTVPWLMPMAPCFASDLAGITASESCTHTISLPAYVVTRRYPGDVHAACQAHESLMRDASVQLVTSPASLFQG